MQVILGASGQVGSAIVNNLLARGESVRAVVRDLNKGQGLRDAGAEVVAGDASDLSSLQRALKGADGFFVLTPESDPEKPILEKTQQIVDNYRLAIDGSSLSRVVALSSMGAQFDSGTGNLLMSNMLEKALADLAVPHVFVRPAYYFSNWLMAMEPAKRQHVLPTFFPADLKVPMVAPADVAAFCAWLLTEENSDRNLYALNGPSAYSSAEVADAFAGVLGAPVQPAVIPRSQWEETLQKTGQTTDGIRNFIEMTEAVISGKATQKDPAAKMEKAKTTLIEFLRETMSHKKERTGAVAG